MATNNDMSYTPGNSVSHLPPTIVVGGGGVVGGGITSSTMDAKLSQLKEHLTNEHRSLDATVISGVESCIQVSRDESSSLKEIIDNHAISIIDKISQLGNSINHLTVDSLSFMLDYGSLPSHLVGQLPLIVRNPGEYEYFCPDQDYNFKYTLIDLELENHPVYESDLQSYPAGKLVFSVDGKKQLCIVTVYSQLKYIGTFFIVLA